MGTYQQQNEQWKVSPSEQVLWYGEAHQPYQPQTTMPTYTQPGQYQQPYLYQQPGQSYWNPNTGFPNQSFAPMTQNQLHTAQARKVRAAARMPKVQAQSLARNLKKGVLVSSLAAFGVLSVLVARNLQNTSASPSSPNQNQITDPSQSNSDSGNYFNQGRGGGNGFGNNPSGQNPGTGTWSS